LADEGKSEVVAADDFVPNAGRDEVAGGEVEVADCEAAVARDEGFEGAAAGVARVELVCAGFAIFVPDDEGEMVFG